MADCWCVVAQVMAPQQGVGYGQAADIWSFGITMLEVATGKAPTARRSVNEILISVLSSPEDDPSSIAGELSHTPEVTPARRLGPPRKPQPLAALLEGCALEVLAFQHCRAHCAWTHIMPYARLSRAIFSAVLGTLSIRVTMTFTSNEQCATISVTR